MNDKAISGRSILAKWGLLALALAPALLFAFQALAAEQKTQSTPSSATSGSATSGGSATSSAVTFRDGRLTVETRGESLADLLAEVQKKSGIKFHVRKTLPADAVAASFRDVPVETAIQRLLGRDFDLVWFYAAPKTGKGSATPTEVWVVGRGERVGGAMADAGKGAAKRQAKSGDDSDLKERLTQIGKLADEEPAKALPLLFGALSDQDPRIRAAAAEALGELGDPSAVQALGSALAKDADSDVREAAAEALGELGSATAVPALRAGLKDADEDVREAVVEALAEIGGPEAERVLRQALADPDEDVREAAAAALAKLKQTQKK